MISGYDCAIFDMDGTLLDSMIHWRMQNVYFLKDRNLPVPEEVSVNPYFYSSHRAAKLYTQLFDLGMTEAEVIQEFESRMEKAYESVVCAKDGVKEYLDYLRNNGVRMCVATLTPEEIAKKALQKHDLLQYFEFVTSSTLSGFNKSDPAYFDMVAQRMGSVSSRCMVFEDSSYAAQGAKKAHCRVIAVEDPTNEPQRDELRAISDVYIHDFTQLSMI